MASTWPAEVELLRELVAIPSVSGEESAVAAYCEATVRGWGLDVTNDETGVKVELRGREPVRSGSGNGCDWEHSSHWVHC